MTQTCEHGQLLLFLKRFVPHIPYKFASIYLLSFPLSLLLNTSFYILVSILDGLLSRTCCGYYFYNFSFLALRRWHDFSLSSLRLKGEGFYIPEGDINPALPSIAQKYFNLKVDGNNKIIIKDGVEFVKNAPEKEYEIVLIDAFDKDYIPPALLSDEFMQNIKKVMKENGAVAINTFIESKYQDLESNLFKNNFGSYYNLCVGANRVVLTTKGEMPKLKEIAATSYLWLDKFVEINVSQPALLSLFQDRLM